MPYNLAADKANSTLEAGDHPNHHNALANAVNDLDVNRVQPVEDALSSAGDNVYTGLNVASQRIDIRTGTSASPDTSLGPVVRVSKTDALTRADYIAGGGPANSQTVDETAAIHGSIVGTSASQMQTTGVIGTAKQSGNSRSGTAGPDALGVYGFGWVTASDADGRGIGGYFEGRSASTQGKVSGVEIQAVNRSGSDHTYNSAAASTSVGVLMSTSGNSLNQTGCGIQFTQGNGNPKYDVGIGFASADGGPVLTASIRDDGNAATCIDINGTHTAAIDIAAGAGPINMNTNYINVNQGYLQFNERSNPGTPAANLSRLFTQDNGAGKTQLLIQFASGAAQVIATQP